MGNEIYREASAIKCETLLPGYAFKRARVFFICKT